MQWNQQIRWLSLLILNKSYAIPDGQWWWLQQKQMCPQFPELQPFAGRSEAALRWHCQRKWCWWEWGFWLCLRRGQVLLTWYWSESVAWCLGGHHVLMMDLSQGKHSSENERNSMKTETNWSLISKDDFWTFHWHKRYVPFSNLA